MIYNDYGPSTMTAAYIIKVISIHSWDCTIRLDLMPKSRQMVKHVIFSTLFYKKKKKKKKKKKINIIRI